MKSVFQVTLCLSLLAAALPGAALAAEEFSKDGLIFWLKGDAGITKDAANKITEWQDQSGAGSHATGVAATAPVLTTEGGLSFAHFDRAAGNFLNISKTISATNFTIVAAIRFGAAPKDQFSFWFGGDNGQGCHAGGGGVWKQLPIVGWGMFKGTSEDWPFMVTNAAPPTDLGVISITNKHLYRNMLDAGMPTPFTSQPYARSPELDNYLQQKTNGMAFNLLGTNSNMASFTGDIFEVLVFNQSLTTGERVKVESYLMSRYNVAKPAYSAGVEPPTSGLALWLKADAGITKNAENKITEWKDQSGANRHATNADAATAPLFKTEGGRSMVSFLGKGVVVGYADDGKDSYLNCAVSAEKYTVFGVMRKKDPQFLKWNGHHNEYSFWFGGQGHGLVAGGRSSIGGGTSHFLGWGIAWGEKGWEGQYIGDVVDTGWVVMTVNNHGIWRNGMSNMDFVRIDRDVHMGVPKGPERDWILPAINLTELGGVPGTPWEHDPDFLGDLAEVLIYDRVLLTPERGMVEEYLLTKHTIAADPLVRAAPALIARGAPVLQGLQLRLPASGVYAIDIFTPRGARAGSFQVKAPGAFDLSHAGLSNGLYQIRVRNGADIFWLKAPVVR